MSDEVIEAQPATWPMTSATSHGRIRTTHVGSLPRPAALLDLMKAKIDGALATTRFDQYAYDETVRGAVADIVRAQVDNGINIVGDGEMSKPGFFTYVQERLAGFEPRPGAGHPPFAAEVAAFPEYYAEYFRRAMFGATLTPVVPLVCVGPISYRGADALQSDLDNLNAALGGVAARDAFVPAVAPSGVGINEYYKTDEEYLHAVGAAMRVEYRAIVDAGFMVQVDDPFMADVFSDPALDAEEKTRRADLHVEVINEALAGIAPEKVRFHTCYGINEGPRIHDASLSELVGHMLRVNAGSYSFEAANCRHEHEYHLWETVKLPDGKSIMPGVITHASNIVEHPELIAERLVRFANLVGRDNVIASADCGFSSQACYRTEVDPKVMWTKFRAMAEGAAIASRKLWP